MKAIKFLDYIANNGIVPFNPNIIAGNTPVPLSKLLAAEYGQAYIYIRNDDDITSARNSFAMRVLALSAQYTEMELRRQQAIKAQSYVLNDNAIHEKVQQKRPPVGDADFESAYTDGGTVRDISGGSFPASLYNDVLDWKASYQAVIDLFRPLFHFSAPMSWECVEVWE